MSPNNMSTAKRNANATKTIDKSAKRAWADETDMVTTRRKPITMRTSSLITLGASVFAALFSFGCEGNGSTSTIGSAGGAGDTSDVTGTLADTYITTTGDVLSYNDSGAIVSALIPDANGGFSTIQGSVAADGSFTIPAVPDGLFYLELLPSSGPAPVPTFFVTTEHKLDLGHYRTSRPNAQTVNVSPTNVTFNVTGLSAWQDTDLLILYSLGAGLYGDVSAKAKVPPTVGATSLVNLTVDVSTFLSPALVDQAEGDTAVLTQLVAKTSAGVGYQGLKNIFSPTPFSFVNGQPSTLAGAFVSVPQKQVSLTWKRSLFVPLTTDVNPAASLDYSYLQVGSEAAGNDRTSGVSLASLVNLYDYTSTDVSLNLSYGNPFPAAWAEVGSAFMVYHMTYQVPGLAAPIDIPAYIKVMDVLSALSVGGIAPVISPPRNLQINGTAATGALTGVGTSPTLSWSAPSLGTSVAYIVTVRSISAVDGSVKREAGFYTIGTAMTFPPGVLSAGSHYMVRVRAITGYVPMTPSKDDNSSSFADALSGLISP